MEGRRVELFSHHIPFNGCTIHALPFIFIIAIRVSYAKIELTSNGCRLVSSSFTHGAANSLSTRASSFWSVVHAIATSRSRDRDNPNIANIRYFWMMDIANEDTEPMIARALSGAKKKIEEWPGVTFDIDTEAGNAILGSVNGAVIAWFLIQHKEQLGNKWIPKVTAFIKDSGSAWDSAHLLFYVGAP